MNTSSINNDENHFALRGAAGFTLTEILIAIALLVILVGILVANYPTVIVSGQTDATRIFVQDTVDTPLLTYHLDTGNYPTTEEGLQALIVQPATVTGWKGPYLRYTTLPQDPWHHEYHYAFPGIHNLKGYDVWSDGPDGISGTSDDIGNWENPVTTQ
mgnify:FL=1